MLSGTIPQPQLLPLVPFSLPMSHCVPERTMRCMTRGHIARSHWNPWFSDQRIKQGLQQAEGPEHVSSLIQPAMTLTGSP